MKDLILKAMAAARRQISMMVGHAVLSLLNDDAGFQLLQVQLLDGETTDGVQRMQDYGFVSRPLPGAEGVYLSVMGVRGEGVVLALGDRRVRLRGLVDGEVAIHDDQDQVVILKRDGIEISSPFRVSINAPTVQVSAETVSIDAETCTITATTADIDAAHINLGGAGGLAVARVGDTVVGGVITQGSTKVKAT